MNIVVNAVLAFEQPRGVGRYVNTLLPSLAEIDKSNEYYVYYGKWMKGYTFLTIRQPNFHFIELDIKNNILSRNLYLATILPLKCKKYHPDILFLVDTQAIIIKPCVVVSTIHDIAEFVVPEKYSSLQAFFRKLIVKHQAIISDRIMTVSHYSKKDICRRLKINEEKIRVVYNSIETPNEVTLCKPENYFLYVSEIERAKNLLTLVKAYGALPDSIKNKYMLYVVGKKGNDYDNVVKTIKQLDIEERVKYFGFVSDKELDDLYAKSFCFIFPSLFEGFGMPVLEAMAKGTPVLCSNVSSIPEVGGDAVLTFDPYSYNEIKDQIVKLVETEKLREELIDRGIQRAKQFNMRVRAIETLNVLQGNDR